MTAMGGEAGQSEREEAATYRAAGWCSAILGLGVVLFFGWMVWEFRWLSDDGFINVRIVENILAGLGPVFNPGERVEAYTSPLWVALLSSIGAMGVNVPWASVGAGLVGSVLGLGSAQVASLVLREGSTDWIGAAARRWAVPAGALTYAVVPVTWDYGTSGLENGLTMAWLGGSYLALALYLAVELPLERRDWRHYGMAVLVGLGPLVRPELALFSMAFAAPLLVRAWRQWREESLDAARLLEYVAAAVAIPVVYEFWRMGYFAAVVPNTAIAKSAFEARWQQGWYYTQNFFGFYLLAIPLLILATHWLATVTGLFRAGAPARAVALVSPVLAGLGEAFYLVRMGGGFMHGRLFLPALFGMLLPVAAIGVRGDAAERTVARGGSLVALGVWAALCGYSFRIPEENVHHIGDERNWYTQQAGVENPVTVEDYEKMHFTREVQGPRRAAERYCPSAFGKEDGPESQECERIVYVDRPGAGKMHPDRRIYPLRNRSADEGVVAAVLRTAMGLKSLVLGRHVHLVDRAGLASPIAARLAIEHRGRPGHEKQMGNHWYIGRFAAREGVWDARVAAARDALECGRLGALDRAVTDPLTLGRFFRNIGLSLGLRGLKIPRDPFEARAKFCGSSRPLVRREGGAGGVPGRWICPEGYALAGFEGAPAEEGSALAHLRPLCRPLEQRGGSKERELVRGPRYGGDSTVPSRTVTCEEGETVVALEGGADRFTHRLRLRCGDVVEAGAEGSTRAGLAIGEGPSDFTIRCPEGRYAAGFAPRSGSLIDAIGLVCRSSEGRER